MPFNTSDDFGRLPAMPSSPPSWTHGAPKWAAIIVLGGASLAGLGWALGRESSAWGKSQPQQQPAVAFATPVVAPPTVTATKEPTPAPSPTSNQTPSARKLVNVNTATQSELELLPGIGAAYAKRIIEYRATHAPFKRIEDLDPIKGIGPRTIERLRPLVTFE
jgi:comEA protein